MSHVTDSDAKEVLVIKNMAQPWRSSVVRLLRGRSLAGQFLVFQLLVVGVVLFAVAAVSVAQSTREFRDVRGQRMIAVAENMASTPIAPWRSPVQAWRRFSIRTAPAECRRILLVSDRGWT